MAHWLCGYVAGAYGGAPGLGAEISLNVPGPIRRIVAGFYIHNDSTAPIALTPVQTADAANEVMIYTKKSIKIYTAGALTNPIIYLFVETELEYPSKQAIPA